MNAEEIAKAFESVPLVFNGEIPESINCLYYSGELIEITEEQREELTKILKKHDAIRDKLVKLYRDWHKKRFL